MCDLNEMATEHQAQTADEPRLYTVKTSFREVAYGVVAYTVRANSEKEAVELCEKGTDSSEGSLGITDTVWDTMDYSDLSVGWDEDDDVEVEPSK